jgi:hypothetical protein
VAKLADQSRHRWFTPVILAIKEAKIRRMWIKNQPRQIVLKTLA